MKKNEEIRDLIKKFILNQCNEEELKEVMDFFQNNNSSEEFPTVEEVLELLKDFPEMTEESSDRIYQNILRARKQQQRSHRRIGRDIWKYTAAAVFVGVLLTGIFSSHLISTPSNEIPFQPEEFVTLQLENGDIEIIKDSDSTRIADSEGNVIGSLVGNQLIYDKPASSATSQYNTITIPHGKQFELSLADGTRVHLNAGTSFKYPTNFLQGQKRQVFLEGEAHFDVARDEEHPFMIQAEDLKIQVLGTQFNVSAYPEDPEADVVLVEGSVGMFTDGQEYKSGENTLLEPGYKGSFNKKNQTFSRKEVSTKAYTSWIEGHLIFRDMSFGNILKKLERHFNTDIIIRNPELENEVFNANFGDESLEKILQYFKRIYQIDFEITEEHILIK